LQLRRTRSLDAARTKRIGFERPGKARTEGYRSLSASSLRRDDHVFGCKHFTSRLHLNIRKDELSRYTIRVLQVSRIQKKPIANMVSILSVSAFSRSKSQLTDQGIETPAFILGALTAGGGTFGYIKTGSVPSIAAGITVGVLVSRFTYITSRCRGTTNSLQVSHRWLPHPNQAAIWSRARTPCLNRPCWFLYPKSFEEPKASAYGIELTSALWPLYIWQCIQTEVVNGDRWLARLSWSWWTKELGFRNENC
jgi:uncharacterized membrane protein (UPF0136 family)